MISRNLMQRLQRLEEQIPVGEQMILNIVPIRPDGTRAPGGLQFKIPAYGRMQVHGRGGAGFREPNWVEASDEMRKS
jgi:hypothetical protein